MIAARTLAALAIFASSAAFAGQTGIINQAGPYEQTLKFYLHPAHSYDTTPTTHLSEHPAVLVKARANREGAHSATPAVRIHPALSGRRVQPPLVAAAD